MPARIRRPAIVLVHCPSCRSTQRAQPVGTARLGHEQRQLVECLVAECGLVWAPPQSPTTTSRAA